MRNPYSLILSTLIIICLSCCTNKQEQQQASMQQPSTKVIAPPGACEQSLQTLIDGSTLQSTFKKELTAQTESDTAGEMTIRLLVPGDDGRENIVGWVMLNIHTRSLSDITNDPDHPVKLRYQQADWDRFLQCYIKGKQQEHTSSDITQLNDVFPEGSRTNFTPEEVKADQTKYRLFRQKLASFEHSHPDRVSFESDQLFQLINNEVFSNSNTFVHSSWLSYFLDRYKFNIVELIPVVNLAIVQEDYPAVVNLLNHGVIVSAQQLDLAAQTQKKANQLTGYNAQHKGLDEAGDPAFYEIKYSKIGDILQLLIQSHQANAIHDRDGFSNLRAGKSITSRVINKLNSGEPVKVLDNTSPWFLVESMGGNRGYIHYSKIRSL